MHRVPQDLLRYAVLQLQPPLQGIFYTEIPGIPQFTSTSSSVILSRYPLCIEPWVFLACVRYSFSCPAWTSFAQRAQGPPGPHQSQLQLPCQGILCVQLWDTLACTHFSLNCPAMVPNVWRDLGLPVHTTNSSNQPKKVTKHTQ